MELTIKNYAKINLVLDVLGKRDDGYHEVSMVMQSINLYDVVKLTIKDKGINLSCNNPDVPLDESNLAYKAVLLYREKTGFPSGLEIHIDKEIPVAAGLAGGSGNGAAVLLGLNSLNSNPITLKELMDLGAALGSDVPFCIYGQTALATGRGEKLEALPNCPELWMVLVKPQFGVSTAKVYGELTRVQINARPNNKQMLDALATHDKAKILASCSNVLEYATFALRPEVEVIKKEVASLGAAYAMMSGSGPTVIGFCRNEQEADQLLKKLMNRYPLVKKVRTVTKLEIEERVDNMR